jgi:asparagine synthase (glutamine-hydrolysing)
VCGIAGLLGSEAESSLFIGKMCSIIRHRGPDDAGFVFFRGGQLQPEILGDKDTPSAVYSAGLPYSPSLPIEDASPTRADVALGHRRLSIVDLSPLGHQPMCSADDRYWITYNGEVYNHIELRTDLESKGHRFISHSDTEVILSAYSEWGSECLKRFNGMWGLAILDRHRRTLFLARDRFGVKPLYYWASPRGFLAFASEIKQFTVLPGWQARVNSQRAYDYLVWTPTDHTDETLFDRVYQLPPGACATLSVDKWKQAVGNDGRIAFSNWYQLKAESFAGNFRAAADEFRRRLTDSVRLRMRADVPIGYSLSGGLDSSAVVCVASRMMRERASKDPLRTFSMCATGEEIDERKWVDVVVAETGADPRHILPTSEGLFNAMSTITWHQDEPFGSPAVYSQWCVFREASAAVKVLLGGHGSDEILAGYPPFYTPMFAALARKGKLLSIVHEALAVRELRGYSLTFAPRVLLHSLLPPHFFHLLRRAAGSDMMRPSWIDLKRLGAEARDPFLDFRSRGTRSLPELSAIFVTRAPSPMLLHYEDRSSMAHSFESRVPFLDYRMVEFALGLPDEFKLYRGINKRVLREAGILPEAIRRRVDKIGMGTPGEVWLTRGNAEMFRTKLDEAIEAGQGVLTGRCRDYLEAVISGTKPYDQVLRRMLSFGEWVRVFGVSV